MAAVVVTTAPVRLLDLSDDVLAVIFGFVLSPVQVSSHRRLSAKSISSGLAFACTNTRLMSLFAASLVDLELWSSGTLTNQGLRFLVRSGGPSVRRLILRGCSLLSRSFEDVTTHCTNIRTLDVSLLASIDDDLLKRLCSGVGHTLESLLIRRCVQLTDDGIVAVADHCSKLNALDAAGLEKITDRGVMVLCNTRRDTLRILILSWCSQLTDTSLIALATMQLRAVFLRGLLISDRGIEVLAKGIGSHLMAIDLLDCPNLTNFAFSTSLKEHCAQLQEKLELASSRDMFQNSVSILHGYVHIVAGVSQSGSRSTLICIVDAGSANAFAFQVLSGEAISFESNDVKVLATNSGLAVTDETKDFVKECFGIEL